MRNPPFKYFVLVAKHIYRERNYRIKNVIQKKISSSYIGTNINVIYNRRFFNCFLKVQYTQFPSVMTRMQQIFLIVYNNPLNILSIWTQCLFFA